MPPPVPALWIHPTHDPALDPAASKLGAELKLPHPLARLLARRGITNVAQARYNSMARLKSWAANYSAPQIVAGDFNADPDQIDTLSGMLPTFVDTWSMVGTGRGFTAFGPSPSMKIDYWFSDTSGRAQPMSSQVIYGTGALSDHYPVQTTFVIR